MTSGAPRIQLCGRLGFEWGDRRLEGELRGAQGRLLFAYLVLHRERPVRRDELLEALWSKDGPPPSGEAILSPPLSRLRKTIGADHLVGRSELSLRLPPGTWVDWEAAHADLVAARAAQDPREGLALARSALATADLGLLPGLDASWIEPFRRRLGDLRLEALEALVARGIQIGGPELAPAEQAARAAVDAEPFRESARAALMEVLTARGNVAEALRAFEDLRVLLREELGTSPGTALVALHERVLTADAGSPAFAAAPPPVTTAAGRGALPDRLSQSLAAPFVGRREPLDHLKAGIDRARAGASSLVFITGEAGIGKTRLVAELARGAEDFFVLYGRCDEEELFPFGPWIEMLGSHLARLPDAELPALLAEDGPDLTRLLPELRARVPGMPEPSHTDAETERLRLYGAVIRLVGRLSRRSPLLMVIDDLHWADRSSLLLGRQLVRAEGLGPVFMLGTYRDTDLVPDHPLVEILADLERDMPLDRLRLEGLDLGEVEELLEGWHEGGLEVPAHVIREETDGNPFFVNQLVRHLQESGTLAAPDGLRDVIVRRVARLPGDAARSLQFAALIGRDFELAILERVIGGSEDALLDDLDAAVRAGILVEVASTPGRYSFVHALLRTTLEASLTTTRRSRIHRRIGEAIEERHRDRLDPWLADLARHFLATGPEETDRAVSYCERAAEQATARLAYTEAAGLLEQAVGARERDRPVDPAEHVRLLMALAEATWRAGRWDAARGIYQRAAGAADTPETFARAALGHAGGVWDLFGTDDPASAQLLEASLERMPLADSALRAQVLARLSSVLYYSAEPAERGRTLAEDAVAMARRLDDPQALAIALGAAQYTRWRPGMAEERLPIADELVALAERLAVPSVIAEASAWRAFSLLELGRRDEAEADLARHAEIAETLQQPQLLVHRLALRTMLALLDGRFADAEVDAAEVIGTGERFRAAGIEATPIHLQYYGVEMIAMRNEQLRMEEVTEYFGRLVREIGMLPGWRTPLAWAHVQAGRLDEARVHLDELRRDGYAVLPFDANYIPALTIIAHTAAELRDPELAEELEPRLRPYARYWTVLGPGPATLGPVAYCLGVLALLRDEPETARADLEQALERSLAMRARPYEARSRLALAEAMRRTGEPGEAADDHERRAVAIAEELGMVRLLREAGAADLRP